MSEATAEESEISAARRLVLAWLREPHRNPRFLSGAGEADLTHDHGPIVERFLSWIHPAGFDFELIDHEHGSGHVYNVHWRYHGCELIGFKQSPPAPKPDDAKLLACAGLLRNDWCCARLP
jgi:hypothetical protein